MAADVGYNGPVTQPPVGFQRWHLLNDEILDRIHRRTRGDSAPIRVLAGLRSSVLNFATISVCNHLRFGRQIQCEPLPEDTAQMEDQIRAAREGGGEQRIFLITGEIGPDECPPAVDQAKAETTAQASGYTLLDALAKPDRRAIRIWEAK